MLDGLVIPLLYCMSLDEIPLSSVAYCLWFVYSRSCVDIS